MYVMMKIANLLLTALFDVPHLLLRGCVERSAAVGIRSHDIVVIRNPRGSASPVFSRPHRAALRSQKSTLFPGKSRFDTTSPTAFGELKPSNVRERCCRTPGVPRSRQGALGR